MFRHTGGKRTFKHNLKLASLLSFVAGVVNVTGFFSIYILTTNVTGHFANFADELVRSDYLISLSYLLYILAFFAGAFCSGLIVEATIRKTGRNIYMIPLSIEILLLIVVSALTIDMAVAHSVLVACTLLFAMGLQNALVTTVSNSVVRTTHLTGLFTDLGIELSQLFFYKEPEQQQKLKKSVGLRGAIIGFFFAGCVIGGIGYFIMDMRVLLIAAALLLGGMFWDNLKYRYLSIKRKYIEQ